MTVFAGMVGLAVWSLSPGRAVSYQAASGSGGQAAGLTLVATSAAVDEKATTSSPALATVTPTVQPPQPTPTYHWRSATGGPYIRQAEAVEKGMAIARTYGTVDVAVLPQSTFTNGMDLHNIIDMPNRGSQSQRELWVVAVEGAFKPLLYPPKAQPKVYRKVFVVLDATTGAFIQVSLREELQ